MEKRIAIWAGVGILGTGVWAALIFATTLEQFLFLMAEPTVRIVLYVSCPVMYLARYCPLKLWGVLLANAATFAFVGLMVEMLLAKLRRRVAT